MVEIRTTVCDGRSLFTNETYVGHRQLHDTVRGLLTFKDHIHGGLFNVRFGEFGAEYASGALDIRLHFRKHAKIFIRVHAQSEFRVFEDRDIASEATLFLSSEPVLLDNFIVALAALSDGTSNDAEFEAIRWD